MIKRHSYSQILSNMVMPNFSLVVLSHLVMCFRISPFSQVLDVDHNKRELLECIEPPFLLFLGESGCIRPCSCCKEKKPHWAVPNKKTIFVCLFFNWRIIALQCGVGFYMYTFIPSLLSLPHLSPPHPSGSSQHWAELPVLYSRLPLVICFTHDSVYMSMPLSPFMHLLLPPLCPQAHPLCAIPAWQVGSSVPFF